MTLNQVFKYLDENVSPESGGKIQIIPSENKELIRIFIFDKKINSYSYIFNFSKENIDNKDVFVASIRSGYSGIDYKLGLALTLDLFNSIKETLITADNIYMKSLEQQIDSYKEIEEPNLFSEIDEAK